MNRRGFLGALVGGIATAAAVRTWPFRVYSFPAQPKLWIHPGLFDGWGIPMMESKWCPQNRIYLLDSRLWVFDGTTIERVSA